MVKRPSAGASRGARSRQGVVGWNVHSFDPSADLVIVTFSTCCEFGTLEKLALSSALS